MCTWARKGRRDNSLRDFHRRVGKYAEGFEGVHGGMVLGKEMQKEKRLLEFCNEKEMCVVNTWFCKEEEQNHLQCGWM